METQRKIGFEMSISARQDGTVEALYILVRDAKAARTVEIVGDILLADYDSRGQLVGVEILAPVKISKITSLVDPKRRRSFRKFMKERAPDELVLC